MARLALISPAPTWRAAREQFEQTFADVEQIPRPAYWGGWLLRPVEGIPEAAQSTLDVPGVSN